MFVPAIYDNDVPLTCLGQLKDMLLCFDLRIGHFILMSKSYIQICFGLQKEHVTLDYLFQKVCFNIKIVIFPTAFCR